MAKRIYAILLVMIIALVAAVPAAAESGTDVSSSDAGSSYAGADSQLYTDGSSQVVSEPLDDNYMARVTAIIADETTDLGEEYGYTSRIQQLRVEVLQGPKKGCTAIVIYDLTDTWGGNSGSKPVEVGDKVIVQLEQSADGFLMGYVTMYVRHNAIIVLSVVFVLLLVFLGGSRGLRSLVALLVTCVMLVCVMIPMILNGVSPVLASILACVISIVTTLIIVYGFSVKSLAAGIGSVGGVAVAGIIVLIMNSVMHMTGLIDDTSMYLAQSAREYGNLDLTGVLFAAIIISVLGGTIDVSVSIASSLEELKLNAPDMNGAQLMKSGINIGVDIMGASLNTLILSYMGCAIHIVMIFYTYRSPVLMVFNDEMIVCELLRALAGSSALLFTVPITAYISALMLNKGRFGGFSMDCFASVTIARRLWKSVSEWWSSMSERMPERRVSGAKKTAEKTVETELPDNLYMLAHNRSEKLSFDETADSESSGKSDWK